jgi:hypothetical protein
VQVVQPVIRVLHSVHRLLTGVKLEFVQVRQIEGELQVAQPVMKELHVPQVEPLRAYPEAQVRQAVLEEQVKQPVISPLQREQPPPTKL